MRTVKVDSDDWCFCEDWKLFVVMLIKYWSIKSIATRGEGRQDVLNSFNVCPFCGERLLKEVG